MKIAIVGPQVSVDRIKAIVARKEPFIECLEAPYTDLSQVARIVEDCQPQVDGVLFSGQTPFYFACHYVTPTKPWEYLPRNMISTLCALLRASYLNHYDIRSVSEDGFADNTLLQTYDEIGFAREEVHIYSCPVSVAEADYCKKVAKFHSDLYRAKKVGLCLTGLLQVESILKEQGIPVVRVAINVESTMDRVSQLRLSHEATPAAANHVAVVMISVSFLREHSLNSRSEFQLLQQVNHASEIVYALAAKLNAAVVSKGQTYYLFTTYSQIERETGGFKRMPLLGKFLALDQGAAVTIGIGLGDHPAEAKRKAEIGCKKAERYGVACFVIRTNGQMIGPITEKLPDGHIPLADQNLYLISQKASISIDTLNLIDQVQKQYDLSETTPTELAKLCGLPLRSMNRLLQKLIDAGYAVVVGKESARNPGRPRRIIRLRLVEHK